MIQYSGSWNKDNMASKYSGRPGAFKCAISTPKNGGIQQQLNQKNKANSRDASLA